MDARILIKNSTSKCNKELLTWLHSNINTLKKKMSLKVIIVYENLYPKLENKIKKLPALVINGNLITGNNAIKTQLSNVAGASGVSKKKQIIDGGSDDLMDYWNAEMHSGADDNCDDETEDMMDQIKKRALDMTMTHKENLNKKPKRKETIVSSARQDNIQLDIIKPDKISDMVSGDPMMQKFWENQETSPGFD